MLNDAVGFTGMGSVWMTDDAVNSDISCCVYASQYSFVSSSLIVCVLFARLDTFCKVSEIVSDSSRSGIDVTHSGFPGDNGLNDIFTVLILILNLPDGSVRILFILLLVLHPTLILHAQ